MRSKFIALSLLVWVLMFPALLTRGQAGAQASGMKIQVHLLWGTDAATSPNTNHTPVDPELRRKLPPLRWKNYFTVRKFDLVVPPAGSKKEPVSDKCAVEVRDLGNSRAEVSYFGKNKNVEKRTLAFPKGETLVYGGNAPGTNTWLLVLKRVE